MATLQGGFRLAEGGGRQSGVLPEDAAEVRNVAESALVAHLLHRQRSRPEEFLGEADAAVGDRLHERLAPVFAVE